MGTVVLGAVIVGVGVVALAWSLTAPTADGPTEHEQSPARTAGVAGSEAVAGEIDPAELLDICLAENDRRLSGYDPRLIKPTTVPRLARIGRRFMRRRAPRGG
jgi:hypothetical protein